LAGPSKTGKGAGKRLDDYYNFDLPAFNYFNSAHSDHSPRLRYKGEYVCGEWYDRYVFEGDTTARIPKESFLVPGRRFLEMIRSGDKEFMAYLFNTYSAMVVLAEEFEQMNYEDMRSGKVRPAPEFYPRYIKLFPMVIGFGYPIDMALSEYAEENKINPHDIPVYGESFISHEERELQQITLMTAAKKQEKQLQEHAWKYSYIFSNYAGYHPVPLEYFRNRLPEVRSKKLPAKPKATSSKMPTTINEWIGFSTYIRDVRKQCNMIYNAMADRYLREECKRMGLAYDQAVFLTPEEFEEQKSKGLKDYHHLRIAHATHNGLVDISEEEWDALVIKDKDSEDFVKGAVASKGKVQGIARIVMGPADFHKVRKGDILISSMTRPEFGPVLKKVAGIVTNEGGITCHAAIVARELKLPCVIGTVNATKVFKDDDLVEVDANAGIVKILEQGAMPGKSETIRKVIKRQK
jgi:phosphohistidine swiveling domain-containing protein